MRSFRKCTNYQGTDCPSDYDLDCTIDCVVCPRYNCDYCENFNADNITCDCGNIKFLTEKQKPVCLFEMRGADFTGRSER